MNRRLFTLIAIAVGALTFGALAISPFRAAEAVPKCHNDSEGCPDPPPTHGGPTSTYPAPQSQPPAPFATPSAFSYDTFGLDIDTVIKVKLSSVAPNQPPWPLANVPYQAPIPGMPVNVRQVANNLWAFTSFAAGGRAFDCQATCSDGPEMPFNVNTGRYQATLRLRPRLHIEFWKVAWVVTGGRVELVPEKVTEVTATLYFRAFAECVGWESASGGVLNALIGLGNVTIERDSGILEDIWDFFVPGFTAAQNNQIRDGLMNAVGVGQFANIPFVAGAPCFSLGVRGGSGDGAIVWNQEPRQSVVVPGNLGDLSALSGRDGIGLSIASRP